MDSTALPDRRASLQGAKRSDDLCNPETGFRTHGAQSGHTVCIQRICLAIFVCSLSLCRINASAAKRDTEQKYLTSPAGYSGDLKAVAEMSHNNTSVVLRLEVEDPMITPPWRDIRSGDHVTLTLAAKSGNLDLAFPAPSYSETQIIPLAGLPPTKSVGEKLTAATTETEGNTLKVTFNNGNASMAIENAYEARLVWQQEKPGAAKVQVENSDLNITSFANGTNKLFHANVWEPLKALNEQPEISVIFSHPEKACLTATPAPYLLIVPKTGWGHPEAMLSGRRTQYTYAVNLILDLNALNIHDEELTLSLTVFDARLGKPPEAACKTSYRIKRPL